MPTIEISLNDLCRLARRKFSGKGLEEALQYVKGEVESADGDRIKIDIADTNRPDLWSTEGIARELRAKCGNEKGLAKFPMKKSGLKVIVERNLAKIRPRTVCAVVRGLKIDDEVLFQMIQLQEKICDTFGRKRREVALGIYDLSKISPPIFFRAYDPHKMKFVPLDFNRELDLEEILAEHPKGKEYGQLLSGFKKYPVFIDSMDHVLSMPPVINSDFSGKVTRDTRDVFIECSGFSMKFLMPALNIMVAALADRGGRVETVDVVFPDGNIQTPDFSAKKITLNPENVRRLSGIDIKNGEMKKILLKSRYGVAFSGGKFVVSLPPYRNDIMHEVDVIEDVVVSYGYNNIEPMMPQIASAGRLAAANEFSEKITEIMVGLGAQEILSYMLTNKDSLLKKMNVDGMKVIELENPVSKNWCVFRSWLLPSLMGFLAGNTNREYPQNVFEIGEVVVFDPKAETRSRNPAKLAWAYAGSEANFTKARQHLDFIMRSIGLEFEIEEIEHPSFISGRVGSISVKGKEVALLGEVHPAVLGSFGIEQPVCALEADLSKILEIIQK
jgi:phenylalanyl-tRNA synthetase beta chain